MVCCVVPRGASAWERSVSLTATSESPRGSLFGTRVHTIIAREDFVVNRLIVIFFSSFCGGSGGSFYVVIMPSLLPSNVLDYGWVSIESRVHGAVLLHFAAFAKTTSQVGRSH